MKNSGAFADKWKNLLPHREKKPVQNPVPEEQEKERLTFGQVIRVIFGVIYRLRSIFLAVPVVFAALRLAAYNSEHLPLLVGINLQTTGEFAKMISRQTAVTFPLMLTGGCLLLMFLSRKPIYPWLISIFTLTVPVLLLLTNMLYV